MGVVLPVLFLFLDLNLIRLIFDLYVLLSFFDSHRCLHLHFPSTGSLDLKLVGTGLNDLSVYKDFPLEGEDFENGSRPFLD